MLSWILLALSLVISIWYIVINPMNYWKRRGVKHGNSSWLFGDIIALALSTKSFAEWIENVYQQNPGTRYSGIYQLGKPTLLVRDPHIIKQITVKDFDHFVDRRSVVPEGNDPLFAKNLFSLRGNRWKDMRPILSPQFTSSKMKSIFLLMTDCIHVFLDHISKRNKEGIIELELKDAFARLGVDVIASIAFGVKVDTTSQPNNEFYQMGKEAINLKGFWVNVKIFGYQLFPSIFEIFKIGIFSTRANDFFKNIINETIKLRENKTIVRTDLIQLLVDARNGVKKYEESSSVDTGFATVQEAVIGKVDISARYKYITNDDIGAQAMIFFFGGFDGVSNFMSFIAYELAINPDIQDRLRQEILEIENLCGEKVTYEALMKMQYMDMVICETLRKWPVGIQMDRVCTKPYTIEPKYPDEQPVRLEVGDSIVLPIYAIHRDPKYYPDPEKFDPERFSDENKHKINQYLYVPFGVGPRNCIGSRFALLEAKTLIFYLLASYELVPTYKTVVPPQLDRSTFNLLLEGGFHLGLKPL